MQSLILFLIGALFGFYLLSRILGNRPTGKGAILFHTIFVLSGMILLFMNWANTASDSHLNMSLLFLVLASLGGMTMVFMDVVKKLKPPAFLAIGHMLLALTGVTFLALYLFG